jgi:hypothetical protein
MAVGRLGAMEAICHESTKQTDSLFNDSRAKSEAKQKNKEHSTNNEQKKNSCQSNQTKTVVTPFFAQTNPRKLENRSERILFSVTGENNL